MIGDELRACFTRGGCSRTARSRSSTRATSRWSRRSCARRAGLDGEPARLAGVGVFVLGGLLLFTVGLFMIGDRQMAFAKRFTDRHRVQEDPACSRARSSACPARRPARSRDRSAGGARRQVPGRVRDHARSCTRSCGPTRSRRSRPRGWSAAATSAIGSGSDAAPPRPPDATIPEQGAVRDRRADAADGRHAVRRSTSTIDEMKVDVQRAVVSGADTVDNANKLLSDDQRRRQEHGDQRGADLRRRRRDHRDHPLGQGHASASS